MHVANDADQFIVQYFSSGSYPYRRGLKNTAITLVVKLAKICNIAQFFLV